MYLPSLIGFHVKRCLPCRAPWSRPTPWHSSKRRSSTDRRAGETSRKRLFELVSNGDDVCMQYRISTRHDAWTGAYLYPCSISLPAYRLRQGNEARMLRNRVRSDLNGAIYRSSSLGQNLNPIPTHPRTSTHSDICLLPSGFHPGPITSRLRPYSTRLGSIRWLLAPNTSTVSVTVSQSWSFLLTGRLKKTSLEPNPNQPHTDL